MSKNKPLYIQINEKFISKIKAAKIFDDKKTNELESVINASSFDEKRLEALFKDNEIKKT